MRKHDKALESLLKSIDAINALDEKKDKEEVKNDNELPGLKLVAFYNIGVEYEHLFHREKSRFFYQEAYKLADKIGEHDMKARLK